MNVPREYATGTLRLSLGRHTTIEEIDIAAKHIVETIQHVIKRS
jgi:cysteine sulfinate desulfinase/cysteine desulfurase-like protein